MFKGLKNQSQFCTPTQAGFFYLKKMENKLFTVICGDKEYVVKAKCFFEKDRIYFFCSDEYRTKIISQFPINRTVIFIKDK